MTASLQNVSALLENDIEREVSKGQEEFEEVRSVIQNIVDDSTPVIANSIRTAGVLLVNLFIRRVFIFIWFSVFRIFIDFV